MILGIVSDMMLFSVLHFSQFQNTISETQSGYLKIFFSNAALGWSWITYTFANGNTGALIGNVGFQDILSSTKALSHLSQIDRLQCYFQSQGNCTWNYTPLSLLHWETSVNTEKGGKFIHIWSVASALVGIMDQKFNIQTRLHTQIKNRSSLMSKYTQFHNSCKSYNDNVIK